MEVGGLFLWKLMSVEEACASGWKLPLPSTVSGSFHVLLHGSKKLFPITEVTKLPYARTTVEEVFLRNKNITLPWK